MPNYSLSTRFDIDVLDGHLLLALAPMFIENLNLAEVDREKLFSMFQVLFAPLQRQLGIRDTPQAFYCGSMCGDHLHREHALHFIFRPDPF